MNQNIPLSSTLSSSHLPTIESTHISHHLPMTINQSIDQSIIILSEQMQKHCSHCTSIWGHFTCREM